MSRRCTFERLPSEDGRHNFAILCHRNEADRIREALVPTRTGDEWTRLDANGSTHHVHKPNDSSRECIVIPTPDEKGPRKGRTGYSLFFIEASSVFPVDLPPMARKKISWAGRLTHRSVSNDDAACEVNGVSDECNNLQSILQSTVREVCKELTKTFDFERECLRIDVHPKEFAAEVRTAFRDGAHHEPIQLACSASKVSHVVSIIVQSTSASNARIFWGISSNKEHFEGLNQRLNDHATSEIVLEATDAKTGLDKCNGNGMCVQWDAPVSRAYYKLDQVFDDSNLIETISALHSDKKSADWTKESMLSHGAGLDIGASPGGWTQVLKNTLCLPAVVAIDPGVLAQRVMKLGVQHLRSELSEEVTIQGIARHAPYSTIVCDASVSNANELLVKISETLEKVSSLLQNDANGTIYSWPLCLVVTLKLPSKTTGSIERNLEKANSYIPDCLRWIASLGSSSVDTRYKICHLFANSISERTLIAVFNEKST